MLPSLIIDGEVLFAPQYICKCMSRSEMSSKSLVGQLQTLSLSDREYLLFEPEGHHSHLRSKFKDIPKYLFRVSTPRSDGITNEYWVKSMDVRHGRASGDRDIFGSEDYASTATMINRHLRWWVKKWEPDNLVSWTSSLLFALVYIFYRHKNNRDGSDLKDISLCILDTSNYPERVFIRDMDLICAFEGDDPCRDQINLKDLHQLRDTQYYFGEYLWQGALNIENRCQIITAQALLDAGLCLLFVDGDGEILLRDPIPQWANKVVELRQRFRSNLKDTTVRERQAVTAIAQLVSPSWRLSITAYFLALAPRKQSDNEIIKAFRGTFISTSTNPMRLEVTAREKKKFFSSNIKVIASAREPDLRQVQDIFKDVYTDYIFNELRGKLRVISPNSGLIFVVV